MDRHKTWQDLWMRKPKRLLDEYQFPGFRPIAKIKGKFGDSQARIIPLVRRQKKRYVVIVERAISIIMTVKRVGFEIYRVVQSEFIWKWTYAASTVISVAR